MNQNQKMKKVICSDLQIPEEVIRRVEDTLEHDCGAAGRRPESVKSVSRGQRRFGWSGAVAAVVALCLLIPGGTVLAAYISGEHSAFYQTVFGTGSRGSLEEKAFYENGEDGKLAAYRPNYQREEVDEATAEVLIGDYLVGESGTYQLKHYNGDVTTVTVENFLYDTETGSYFVYFSLERDSGGFPDLLIDPESGLCSFAQQDFKNGYCLSVFAGAGRMYFDSENSTENKVYINFAGAYYAGLNFNDSDHDAMILKCLEAVESDQVAPEDYSKALYGMYEEDGVLYDVLQFDLGTIYLPEVTDSLPATSLQVDGETAVIFSAVGIRLRLEVLPGLDNGVDDNELKYLALEYADGTRYVMKDGEKNIDNCDYGLIMSNHDDGWTDGTTVTYCFNRLVDPSQVVKVICNDRELPVS